MKKIFGILLALALVLSFSVVATTPVAAATTYYVAPDGDNANDGFTPGTAWETIQYAVTTAGSGDTIRVAAGTYQESLGGWRDIEVFKSLSIIGAGSGVTIVELSGLQHGVAIRPDATGVVLMEGITFTRQTGNSKSADWAIIVGETGGTFNSLTFRDVEVAWGEARNVALLNATYHNTVVENCNIHHGGTWGFSARGVIGSMTVQNSHFDYNGWFQPSHGIGFDIDMPTSVGSLDVTGGTFNNNTSKGINMVKTRNATFTNITASNNGGAPSGGFGVCLWEWSGTSENLVFNSPVLQDNDTDGFLIGSQTGMTVRNVSITCGTLSGNGRAGLFLYREADWGVGVIEDVVITQSSIIGNSQWGVASIMPYELVDARDNWWGANSGPGGDGPGTGDKVTGALYDPWIKYTAAAPTGEVLVSAGSGNIVGLTPVSPPSLPSVTFPHGMFSFQICCLTPGQTVDVIVTLPSAVPVGTVWWKYDNGRWYSLPNLDDNGDNKMRIRLTDGGAGDSDGLADGFITDPGGPGNPMTVGWDGSSTSKPAVLVPWILLLAAIVASLGLFVWRRRRAQT